MLSGACSDKVDEDLDDWAESVNPTNTTELLDKADGRRNRVRRGSGKTQKCNSLGLLPTHNRTGKPVQLRVRAENIDDDDDDEEQTQRIVNSHILLQNANNYAYNNCEIAQADEAQKAVLEDDEREAKKQKPEL